MRPRPRWGLLSLGALLILGLFTYPIWRGLFQRSGQQVAFPLADAEQRKVLLGLPDRNIAATAYIALLTPVPAPPETTPLPLDAETILSGAFQPLDALHTASGQAVLYRLVDGSVRLRLEDFQVTNAPRLVIYLSGTENPRRMDQLGGIVLEFLVGELQGSTGNQQFEIPRELQLEKYRSVVIVSEALQTIYTVAPID